MNGIIGKKVGMTQVMQKDGTVVPVTLVKIDENHVLQVKTPEKDGYHAVVLATDPLKRPTKNKKFKVISEFRIDDTFTLDKGAVIGVECLDGIEKVTVTGISKGKGFQGVIKRHNFSRGPMTHGSHHHREPGSIGSRKPRRTLKGKRLPGHMGVEQVTVKEKPVVVVDKKNNLVALKGSVPGASNGVVYIKY